MAFDKSTGLRLVRVSFALLALTTLGACFVENDPPPPGHLGDPPGNGTQVLEPSATPGDAGILTGATVSATPGQGAGVFVVYKSGGLWQITATCDSEVASSPSFHQACPFDVTVEVVSGTVTSASLTDGSSYDDSVSSGRSQATAHLVASNGLEGVDLQVDLPGASVIVTELISGSADPTYFYWVGTDNVTHTGAPVDPMQFDPSVQ